jgi:hypothetical protein
MHSCLARNNNGSGPEKTGKGRQRADVIGEVDWGWFNAKIGGTCPRIPRGAC